MSTHLCLSAQHRWFYYLGEYGVVGESVGARNNTLT
jgi:hypothetical protein